MNAIDYGLAVWMVTHPWIMLAAAITASLIALFFVSFFRGAVMVRDAELALLSADPADDMSPAFRVKLWARTAAAVDQARADFTPASSDPGEAKWLRLIDPDSPEYDATAEWWHNLSPELRRKDDH